jgi:hypothetical protein
LGGICDKLNTEYVVAGVQGDDDEGDDDDDDDVANNNNNNNNTCNLVKFISLF